MTKIFTTVRNVRAFLSVRSNARALGAHITLWSVCLFMAAAVYCLATTASFAEGTAEERSDCMSDALSLCGQYVPDAKAIAACMVQKKAKLSPACRKHFK